MNPVEPDRHKIGSSALAGVVCMCGAPGGQSRPRQNGGFQKKNPKKPQSRFGELDFNVM